jgi:tRNA threonylcarbamoyladenosine biosynthesis protein TsaB
MKLLAIETSTESCSVALLNQGEVVEEYQTAPRQHAELTLGMVERLMSSAGLAVGQLDAIAFGRGPGAFTGLRIGCGVVQGIAFAADLPVVPVSTLAAMAQGAVRQRQREKVVPVIDARMEEVYAGAYQVGEDGLVSPVTEECVCKPERLAQLDGAGWFGVGSGWQSYGETLASALGDALAGWEGDFYPHAQDVARLAAAAYEQGLAVTAEQALPVYLRDQVIQNRPSA